MDGNRTAMTTDDWTWLDRREARARQALHDSRERRRPPLPMRIPSAAVDHLRRVARRWQLGPDVGSAYWREQEGRPSWAD